MHFYSLYQQCLQQSQPEQALFHLQQHLARNPEHAAGFFQAGNLLRKLGLLSLALSAFQKACKLDPSQKEYYANAGVLHRELQQPDQALQAFNAALALGEDPAVRFERAMALLSIGCFQEGWREYEWRTRKAPLDKMYDYLSSGRRWQGQPFPGQTLLVHHEQGLGDHLQFCRYLPYVKALGGQIVYTAWPELIPVLSTLQGLDQVLPHNPQTYASLQTQWSIPLMSLPHIFRTTLDSVPNQTPYLSVPSAYRSKWQALLAPYPRLAGTRRIGLVYACKTTNQPHRICPLSFWQPLFSLPGLQWFSLQKGEAASGIREYKDRYANLIDLTGHIDDFADTAALLDELDLLISIDTSVPHLAGALGKPVLLLLPFVSEWRWLLRRSDSPWYPTFRLFRQPLPGYWEPVIAHVRAALLRM